MIQHMVPLTEAEQGAIQTAAARILAHPSFRSSERSSRLFRYLVEQAFKGEAERLKERQIGHEVFGREIGYDTASDPVVRNAASETRKRLRQFDAENGSSEVHIVLPPGTYVLEFNFSASNELGQHSEILPAPASDSEPGIVPTSLPLKAKPSIWTRPEFFYSLSALAVLGCIFLSVALYRQQRNDKSGREVSSEVGPLWAPMFASGKEVFISLGHAQSLSEEDSAVALTSSGLQRITVTDLKAYTNFSGFLQLHGRPFQMRTDTETTMLDLRDRPIVLIGNHNNDWARRLTQNLRFQFDFDEKNAGKPNRVVSIVDSQRPGERLWQVPIPNGPTTFVDYAIAGRFLDPVTGGLVLYVAGAGPVATQAASEFVTQPRFLRNLPENVSDPKVSFEVVLKTPTVAGVPGSPEVVATDSK